MHPNTHELPNRWQDPETPDRIVEVRDGELVATIDGTRHSLSVPDLNISFHRSGEGLTLYKGVAVPTPGIKNHFLSSHSVLFLTDGKEEIRIAVRGKGLLEFEHHQRIESDTDLNLSIQQIRVLRDALLIEGVTVPKVRRHSAPKTFTFSLAPYDPSGLGGPQLKSTLFAALVLVSTLYAWFRILDSGAFEIWSNMFDEGNSLLAYVILAISLLFIGVATKLVFWIYDRLDGRHMRVEHQLVFEDGMARFFHPEDGEIASARIQDLTILPCELRISFFSSRGVSSIASSQMRDTYRKRRLPALQIQFLDGGPTFRVTSKLGHIPWKETPPIISESQVDFEVGHIPYYLMIILLRVQDKVIEKYSKVPLWLPPLDHFPDPDNPDNNP